ncbi:MAG TPA: DUF5676 family membrane protein [Candidatus Nanoarchaeia archaeon]|nr:DUF5676 family membrane protein [Candidatus Nanoarchaeia archaeon]
MADKINATRVSISWVVVTGIVYVGCALAIAFIPGTTGFFSYLFHGIDITKIATTPNLRSTVIGFFESIAIAYLIGWLFAWTYNKFGPE